MAFIHDKVWRKTFLKGIEATRRVLNLSNVSSRVVKRTSCDNEKKSRLMPGHPTP